VVEAALGRPEFDQDFLDAHLLVTLHLDQALGDVDERVSPKGWAVGLSVRGIVFPR